MNDLAAPPVALDKTDQVLKRWGMVIDVNRCVGCQTCTIACKHTNDSPPGVQWRQVIDVEAGTFPDVQRQFLVVGCQHCAEPPCVPVCPTGATRQREDGLVTMDYDTCIGCAYCAVSCPYQARTIVHEQLGYYGEETVQEQAVAHPERVGVAQKCTFCDHRVDKAEELGLTPGVDPEVTPMCSASCIAQAIHFGDFNDPDSNVSTLVRDNPHFQMHEELGTDPQIKYLYTTPAVPGRDPEAADTSDERLRDPANPLVGQLQKFWDWRAAMNWALGGVSSGFAIFAYLAYLTGAVPAGTLAWCFVGAAGLMAVGLFFVFLKIGRKLRFWRAIARPQTSWMTRELYAVAIFYPAVAAALLRPDPAIYAVVAGAALAFLYCQARILHMARGIPAWRAPLIPWMIVATGLLEGAGLFAFASALLSGMFAMNRVLLVSALALVAINGLLWIAYRAKAKGWGIPPLARDKIGEASLMVHVVGHLFPGLLFASVFLVPNFALVCLLFGGIAAIVGGIYWKFTVITQAAYHQGFAMPKIPQRGSGSRAAPARLGMDQAEPQPVPLEVG